MVQLIIFPLTWLLQTVVHQAHPLEVRVGALQQARTVQFALGRSRSTQSPGWNSQVEPVDCRFSRYELVDCFCSFYASHMCSLTIYYGDHPVDPLLHALNVLNY